MKLEKYYRLDGKGVGVLEYMDIRDGYAVSVPEDILRKELDYWFLRFNEAFQM